MPTNRQIVRAAGDPIQTGTLANGLLNPEQARKFIQMTFEATNLGPLVRHEMRQAKTGEVDKIGIASRLLREKVENTDDGYRASVNTSVVKYATTAARLPWEITEETLRENIEGQAFEGVVTGLMTSQLGIDLEDIYLNGDEGAASAATFNASTAYNAGDIVTNDGGLYRFTANHAAGAWTGSDAEQIGVEGDEKFLKLNDGWIKQFKNGGHVFDASSESEMSLDMFYRTLGQLPNKYNNGKLRWLMSPKRQQQWELFLLNKVVNNGGIVPESIYNSPAKIPSIPCPSLNDGTIMLTDPKNLIVVNTYAMQIRKTTEGKEAIMQDKRFYVIHLDFDTIVEELDATAIMTNLPSIA